MFLGNAEPTEKNIDFQWDQEHCTAIAHLFGMDCELGDFDNSAKAMWYLLKINAIF